MRNILQKIIIYFKILLGISYLLSCSPTRYVPEDKYLLKKNKIIIEIQDDKFENKKISKSTLSKVIEQVPNKKTGIRFRLFYYNMSNPDKDKWPHKWFRKIGEPPVIYDEVLKNESKINIKKFLAQKGYLNAHIKDSTLFEKKMATVEYTVIPRKPARIKDIHYYFEDTSIVSTILADTSNSLIQKGMILDQDILRQEWNRLENVLHEHGFYKFDKNYIKFKPHETYTENIYDLHIEFYEYAEGEINRKTMVRNHKKFRINKVDFYPNYNPVVALSQIEDTIQNFDTLSQDNFNFYYNNKLKIHPPVLVGHNHLVPGEIYQKNNEIKTQKSLSSLGLYSFINIQFYEPENSHIDSLGTYPLNARIELTRRKHQFYQTEIVGTNSSGDIGAQGNFLYKNYNMFRGAEIFNFTLSGAFETLKDDSSSRAFNLTNTYEFGTEVKLEIPKFFVPINAKRFIKKYSPKTVLTLAFNHRIEKRYTRTLSTATFGYTLYGNRFLKYSIFPLDLNYVRIVGDDYLQELDTTNLYLAYSLTDHFIAGGRFLIEYNNQEIGKAKSYQFLKLNLEFAGNIPNYISSLSNSKKVDGRYELFKSPIAQYFRGDIDLRNNIYINPKNNIVLRTYIGVGYPYGNSSAMPFEKKFFVGGPNSIRAWRAYKLGPGSKSETPDFRKYENTADIKFEANIEYRFKLFWKLEGALFLDAGNIWNLKTIDEEDINQENTEIENTFFTWNNFYREIALGTGFGARFDFSFFIVRFDLGIKMHDPTVAKNERWKIFNGNFGGKDLTLQFGIGYPF